MYPSSSDGLNYETDNEIYFFTTAFECFSTFTAHRVDIWGKSFATAEHAYQWKKYEESAPDISEQISKANSPDAVKRISDVHKDKMPEGWHERKASVMEEILQAKAQQHTDVREALERSGGKIIIENSPVDVYWGNGPDGSGENMIGKIWMKIRSSIT